MAAPNKTGPLSVHVWRHGATVAWGHLDGNQARRFLRVELEPHDRVTVRAGHAEATYWLRARFGRRMLERRY